MRLLRSGPTRRVSSHWIKHYHSNINHVTYTSSISKASQALRERGPARTRFAPSPTGYLHLGSLRTALFNYLVAKATGGQFILRIEDTDQRRTVPDAVERLYKDLKWTGIDWDEGPDVGGPYGPYKQSERTQLYKKHAEELLSLGKAYRCFCAPERLLQSAQHQNASGLPIGYDRRCAHIKKSESIDRAARGEAHVIRLLAPDRYPSYTDLVYGLVKQQERLRNVGIFEDPILIKSDGYPTYHLANVVDDHYMQVTDVVRGAEWMASTPKHVALYDAFGWKLPSFAHVGLLVDQSRQKLSKRTNSIDVASFRAQGIFPETLTNYVALLGWSHNEKEEIMSMEDLIKHASMKYTKGETIVSFEKLHFLQRRHASRYALAAPSADPRVSLYHLAILPILEELKVRAATESLPTYTALSTDEAKKSYISSLLKADTKYFGPKDFIERNTHFFAAPSAAELEQTMPENLKLRKVPPGIKPDIPARELVFLTKAITEIAEEDWNRDALGKRLQWIVEQGAEVSLNTRHRDQQIPDMHDFSQERVLVNKAWNYLVHKYLRWALCAGKSGPGGVEIMQLLGSKEVGKRLNNAEKIMLEIKQDL